MLTDNELTRLADAIHALRPDWPARSVRAYLAREHRGRAYADVAVAATVVAVDPASQTPARLTEHGPWWVATRANAGRSEVPDVGPGRAAARCDRVGHEHEAADACRPCRAERLAGDEPEPPAHPAAPPADWRPTPPTARGVVRGFAQALPMPTADAQTAKCRCGGAYLDHDAGRASHSAVFGHRPIPDRQPAPDTTEVTT